jgi:hypothetical protein
MYTRALTFENSSQRAHLGAGPRLRFRKIHLHAACWRRAWAWGCGRRGCVRWVAGGCEKRGRSRGEISSSWGRVSYSCLSMACIASSLNPIPFNSALIVLYTHAVTHAHTHAHVACTCTHMRIHVTIHMHMHTHAYIKLGMHMHTHAHTRTSLSLLQLYTSLLSFPISPSRASSLPPHRTHLPFPEAPQGLFLCFI